MLHTSLIKKIVIYKNVFVLDWFDKGFAFLYIILHYGFVLDFTRTPWKIYEQLLNIDTSFMCKFW